MTSRFRPQYLLLPHDVDFERTRKGRLGGDLTVKSAEGIYTSSLLFRREVQTHSRAPTGCSRNAAPSTSDCCGDTKMRRSGSSARKGGGGLKHGWLCLGVNTDWSISALTLCRNQFTNPTEQYCVAESGGDQSVSTFHFLRFFNFRQGVLG